MKALLYSLIPLIAAYAYLEGGRVFRAITSAPLSAYIILASCLASTFYSINVDASVRGIIAVTLITIAPILYRTRYGAEETWRLVYYFVSAAAILNVIYTIAFPQFAVMGGSYNGMVKGLFYHKNLMGHFFAISFFIILLNPRFKIRFSTAGILKIIALACSLLLVILAKSSTAVVMIGVGISIVAGLTMIRPLKNKFGRISLILMICLAAGTAATLTYNIMISTVATAFGKDSTLSGRSGIWEQLIPLVADRPIFGYGFAMFRQPEVFDRFVHASWDVSSTHSTYLELCLNIGIPGTLALVTLILSRLFAKVGPSPTSNGQRRTQALEIIIITLVLVASALDAGMMLAPIVLWPLLLMALPLSPSRAPKPSANPTPRHALAMQGAVLK
ncbi:O-antigen ligase family protein [Pseudomonas sp. ODNR1LW]|nr:O-antigen ligase family protein [Pseudomonas sp. ODNR1LW]